MKKKHGWEIIKNLKDGSKFRFNDRSNVYWEVIKRGKKILAESMNSNQTREIENKNWVYIL